MHKRPPLALCYHGVGDVPVSRDRSRLFVRPRDLERHIRLLCHWGYRLVTFGELARQADSGDASNLAALTFDDGLADNLCVLAPLLASARVPATVFVVSGWLGQPYPEAPWTRVMRADELRALRAAGVEVGGHSTHHDHLPDLSQTTAEHDMRQCRITLEDVLDAPVTVFAYPYGGATSATMAACRAAGYLAACRSRGVGDWQEPFNLPRQDMQNRDSLVGLWLKRENRYERLVNTTAGLALRKVRRVMRSPTAYLRPGSSKRS